MQITTLREDFTKRKDSEGLRTELLPSEGKNKKRQMLHIIDNSPTPRITDSFPSH